MRLIFMALNVLSAVSASEYFSSKETGKVPGVVEARGTEGSAVSTVSIENETRSDIKADNELATSAKSNELNDIFKPNSLLKSETKFSEPKSDSDEISFPDKLESESLEVFISTEAVTAIAEQLIFMDRQLKSYIQFGKYFKAGKRCEQLFSKRTYRPVDKSLREQVIEEVYRRAFKVYIDDHRKYPSIIVQVFAEEVMRRDYDLKDLVLSGNFGNIPKKFEESFTSLVEVIQNGFESKKSEILVELILNSKMNKPDTDDKVDFEALATEAEKADKVLTGFISKGDLNNVKLRFVTKTLKTFSLNSKMNEFKSKVLEVLIKRAEDHFMVTGSMYGYGGADWSLDLDPELKFYVETGQYSLVKNQFITFTLNIHCINSPIIKAYSNDILKELLRRAVTKRIAMRKAVKDADSDAKATNDTEINFNRKKSTTDRRISINPEPTKIHIYEDYVSDQDQNES